MKKTILKSLQPQTKSLFRFKNSDTKSNAFANPLMGMDTSTTTDPTTVLGTTVSASGIF
jgi:hypothetical protein